MTSAIMLAACSGSAVTPAPPTSVQATESPSAGASGAPAVDYKACASFDANGLGDKGFNDLAQKGLEAAKAAGYQTAYTEATGATDYASNIQRLMDEGCQTIIVVGTEQTQAAVEATLANTDIAFAQVDATWDEKANGPTPPNFTGLDFQIDEAATLAGYLAAGFSQSKIIGTYGGEQYPGVTRFMDGYYAGIKIYNEKKGAAAKLLGWDPVKKTGSFVGGDTPWGDLAKGEQFAKQFLDQGADIVAPVAGATGNASIKAMAAAGKWAIGVDTDQALSLAEYSKAILTSAEKRIDVAVLETIKKNAGGGMGGTNFVGTLANGGVAISPFHDLDSQVPAELKAEVTQLEADIASGAIKVADYLK
ncbi:MAG TPA: BMP family ABC transporter substrate-binding protein [Candidatus Limnocylindrales bacterium]